MKQFTYQHYHWGADKKTMDVISKKDKSPETVLLIEKRQEITKHGDLRFKFNTDLNRKVWVPRRSGRGGRDEMAAIDLELLSKNNERNRWGGAYFKLNGLRASSTTERNKQKPENVSSTEESDMVQPPANFPIVDSKDYDNAEKTIHDIQINHVIAKPKTKSDEADEILKKAEINFMVDLTILLRKTSVDPIKL